MSGSDFANELINTFMNLFKPLAYFLRSIIKAFNLDVQE